MTTQYAEEQGFKKKYLAPLIVLMLCAVSLTGAAYAYSTSVTNTGDIDGEYISIDMYESGASGYSVLEKHLTSESFRVYTEKTTGTAAKYTAYIDSDTTTLVYTDYVMISSNIENDPTFTLSGTVKYTAPTPATGNAGLVISGVTAGADPTSLGSMLTVKTAAGVATDLDKLEAGEYYQFTITLTIDTSAAFGTFSTVKELNDAVEAYATDGAFTFTLKADLN